MDLRWAKGELGRYFDTKLAREILKEKISVWSWTIEEQKGF